MPDHKKMKYSELIQEHKDLVSTLESGTSKEKKKLLEEQKTELESYIKEAKKSEDAEAKPVNEDAKIKQLHEELQELNRRIKEAPEGEKEQYRSKLEEIIDKLTSVFELVENNQQKEKEVQDKKAVLQNQLENDYGKFTSKIHEIGNKLKELSEKVDSYLTKPKISAKVTGEGGGYCDDCECDPCMCYANLSKPQVQSLGNGKVTIIFKSDWLPEDKENFLDYMRFQVDGMKDDLEKARLGVFVGREGQKKEFSRGVRRVIHNSKYGMFAINPHASGKGYTVRYKKQDYPYLNAESHAKAMKSFLSYLGDKENKTGKKDE